jgi:hypothetical protein
MASGGGSGERAAGTNRGVDQWRGKTITSKLVGFGMPNFAFTTARRFPERAIVVGVMKAGFV